jgi:hypothetical protein
VHFGLYPDFAFIAYSVLSMHTDVAFITAAIAASTCSSPCKPLSHLGTISIERDTSGSIKLHQRDYIAHIIATFRNPSYDLLTHKSASSPARQELPFIADESKYGSPSLLPLAQAEECRELIDALAHCASSTRPDIGYAVGMLLRCYRNPGITTVSAAHHTLRYLERFIDLGLTYDASSTPLSGMSDSDWPTRRATSGFVFHYGSCAIAWNSVEQPTVALSSCEAELMAVSLAAEEAMRLANLLANVTSAPNLDPISLSVDNKAARDLAYNPEHHDKTKHIDRVHFRLRAYVEAHRLSVPYVNTVDNMADFFTKPLKAATFSTLRDRIMNIA